MGALQVRLSACRYPKGSINRDAFAFLTIQDINIAEDFLHYGLGIDWKMGWASLVLGTTYANSDTSEFSRPLNPAAEEISLTDNEVTQFKFSRWQFIVGIEIPFLNKKIKTNQSQE